jgi:hypothetical protein
VVYGVEFMPAYARSRSVAVAHRVTVAMEHPAVTGAAFMLPVPANGYGTIERRLGAIEGALHLLAERLTRTERGFEIGSSGIEGPS